MSAALDHAVPDEIPEAPMLRVVRGAADDDEIAALVTAIIAVAAGSGPQRDGGAPARRATSPARSVWARPAFPSGTRPGPDNWRRSGLPPRHSH